MLLLCNVVQSAVSLLESTAVIESAAVIVAWSIRRILVAFARDMTQFPAYVAGFRLSLITYSVSSRLTAGISAVASTATSSVPVILVVTVLSIGHLQVIQQ